MVFSPDIDTMSSTHTMIRCAHFFLRLCVCLCVNHSLSPHPSADTNVAVDSMQTVVPATLVFRNMTYTVPVGKGKEKTLLNGITGYALPGTLTALMGASGGLPKHPSLSPLPSVVRDRVYKHMRASFRCRLVCVCFCARFARRNNVCVFSCVLFRVYVCCML